MRALDDWTGDARTPLPQPRASLASDLGVVLSLLPSPGRRYLAWSLRLSMGKTQALNTW
jgi:hypothetical protein